MIAARPAGVHRQAEVDVLGMAGVRLRVPLDVDGVHHRHGLDRLDDRVADEVGEAHLAATLAAQVAVEHVAIDLEQPRRDHTERGRGRHLEAGLHGLHDPGRRPAERLPAVAPCRAIPARGLPVGSRLGCPLRVLDGSSRLGRPLSFLASRSRGRRLLGPGSGSRGRGRGFPRLLARCSLGLLGLVLGEELAPCLTHRGGVVEVLPVDVIDQPHVGTVLRPIEPSHVVATPLGQALEHPRPAGAYPDLPARMASHDQCATLLQPLREGSPNLWTTNRDGQPPMGSPPLPAIGDPGVPAYLSGQSGSRGFRRRPRAAARRTSPWDGSSLLGGDVDNHQRLSGPRSSMVDMAASADFQPAEHALGRFSMLTRAWFENAFAAPTPAQVGAWEAIAGGGNALVVAPTGSGKTLAAFLQAIDHLAGAPPVDPERRLRVLYVSPLKALAADIERNLRAPLAGLRAVAARLGQPLPQLTVDMRTGDTPAEARRRFPAKPPDILITTPESLFLLLTSQAREALRQVETVIVDEVHSVVDTKRGAHLDMSIERLDELLPQVDAPGSVAQGLQRIGRAGHQVGAVSRGIVFPKFRGDLVECAVVVERMSAGAIEAMRYPRNPLDVLAQQVVAMVAMDDWTVERLGTVVRRAAPFAELPRSALESVLDMLSGRYPSDEFAELRPRLNWDRVEGRLGGRPGAQRLAVTSGGTIPDRGLFGVYLVGERETRVGELDEEMVYESRVGEVFTLGASSWRIEGITHDRVLVSPAPGQPGKLPFWHGDAPGRPIELGRALGAFLRELLALGPEARMRRLTEAGLDANAAGNLLQYLGEQLDATGVLPDDRTIVVERFRDELGDWRVCLHTPFGAQVHAPWAQAVEARVRERLGLDVQTMYTDDGIVVRLPEADEAPPSDSVLFDPEEVEDLVVGQVSASALFASRFRECAARALLLPRRRPGQRTPLWQQRQRSAGLLQVASRYGSFPIVLETVRECLQDVFDVPGLAELMASVARREVRVVEVNTPFPSPFASSLQFGYVAAFMYEGDAPLAERRAQALSLDRSILAELLGREELRDLIDPAALADLELELQLLTADRKVSGPDALHDALRMLGELSVDEAAARAGDPEAVGGWLAELEASRRALRLRIAAQDRWF